MSSAWIAATGTALGERHRRRGEPNEDASGSMQASGVTAIAVADGHGDRRCTRARVGARIAVDCAVDIMCEVPEVRLETLGLRLVQCWNAAVDAALAEAPLSGAEAEVARHSPRMLFGTTVVGAVVRDTRLRVLQLGDGDALVGGSEVGELWSSRAARRDQGGDTESLALRDAPTRLHVAEYDLGSTPIEVVLLATDGFDAAFAEPDWHGETIQDLMNRLHGTLPKQLEDAVADWCEKPASIGGDDTTIAVLVRSDLLAEGTTP